MADSRLSVSAGELAQNVTMQVTITDMREMRCRLWLASQLMRVAAWICGMGLEVTRKTTRVKKVPTHRR